MIVTVRYGVGGVPLTPLDSLAHGMEPVSERAEQEEADELLGHQELDVESRGHLRLIDHRRHSTTPDERSQTPIGAWTAR
jgi:hypothetical protein